MIVCVCHRVSESQITVHARTGCSFQELQNELGVATACGACHECALDTFETARARCAGHRGSMIHAAAGNPAQATA